jgi:hypothetical protein
LRYDKKGAVIVLVIFSVIGRFKSSQWRAELGSRGLDVLIFAKTLTIDK